MKNIKDFLPWYINKTLTKSETLEIESWLQGDPKADLYQDSVQQIAEVLSKQSVISPSHQVRAKILNSIHKPVPQSNRFLQWIWGIPLTLLIFSLLWLIIQPGNLLQWSVRDTNAAAYRVYRAPVGGTTFTFVEELPAYPSQQFYQYSDPALIPGQNFNYAIEIVDRLGNTKISQVSSTNTMMALSSQIALLLASFILAFGMITIAQEINFPRQLNFVTD